MAAQEHEQDWKVSGSPHSQLSGELINIQQIWNNSIETKNLHRFSDIPSSGDVRKYFCLHFDSIIRVISKKKNSI